MENMTEYVKAQILPRISACTDDELYSLFDLIIKEMNRRKEREVINNDRTNDN